VWLALFYGIRPDLVVRFDTEPPALLGGVYPAERDPVSGRTFAWTGEQLTLRLPRLDRRIPWNLTLRVRGARVRPADNPELGFLADGIELETRPTTTDYDDVTVVVPPRAELHGLTLAVRASATFVPGPADPRALGVMLDELRLSPSGVAVPPRGAFAGAALAAAAIGASIAALGVTAGSAILAALVVAAGIASTIARGFAPYTDFPVQAARAGIAIAIALALASAGVRLAMRRQPRNTARFALAFSACALLLELLVLLHPDMPIGDALFHAHRFQDVLAGRIYFTSVAPGNYLFPYAPGLYVVASAFADLVARGTADMALLRIVTAAANASSAALLYWVVVRSWGDRLAAAGAVALYHLVPLGFGILTVGNLTNAFAQALSVVALVLMASGSLRPGRRVLTGTFILVLTAAFLSHTSTFAILAVACVFTAILFGWRSSPSLRASGRAVALSLAAAVVLAVVLYYAHFAETYRTELSRIGHETLNAAPDAGGRGIRTRLLSVPRYLNLYFGIPVLILAGWGAARLWQRQAQPEALTRSIAGSALACSAFLVLGIVTPVDMRYYLAAIPIVALVAGFGASAGWSAGGPARAAATGLLAWALATGVRGWWSTIG
jgi:hypothetical protein